MGIDQRPATRQLIEISAWGMVYWIDPTLESELIDFDFNPTVDRIRVDVSTTQNLRLNPEGGMADTDSVPEADETTLYLIDAATNALAIHDPPNDGILNTVGPLSVELADFTGFDIHPNGAAFLRSQTKADLARSIFISLTDTPACNHSQDLAHRAAVLRLGSC